MAGLDPAIGYPHQIANDAIPVSNHPMDDGRVEPSDDVVGPMRVVRQQLGRLVLHSELLWCFPKKHVISPIRFSVQVAGFLAPAFEIAPLGIDALYSRCILEGAVTPPV